MPNENQAVQPQTVSEIDIAPGKSTPGGVPGVMVLLSANAVVTGPLGEPCPGVYLEPWKARRVAYIMLRVAEEMDAEARASK